MPLKEDILKELRDIVGDEYCRTDNAELYVYAFDSSIHRKKPDVVVQPQNTEQVQKVVQLANKHKVPVVPRGAGSGLCGMAVPIDGGIVVDMQRMNKIKDMRIQDLYCVVEPGVVYNSFIAALAPHKFFIPGPASGEVATIGGMIALNASGAKAVKYGATRDYVIGMEFVTPTGEVVRAGANTVKHSSGYQFEKLLVGSEGTLGIITEANIRIIPKPEKRAGCVAAFDDLEKTGQAVADIIANPLIPSQLEIMSQACIAAVNKATNMGLPEVAGMLLIELDGPPDVVKRDIEKVSKICEKAGATSVEFTEDEQRIVQLWKARKQMIPSLSILKEHYVTTMLADDMAVPPSQIPKAVAGIWEISEKYDIIIPPYGHAGDGNLHTKVLMTPSDPEHWKQAQKAVTEIYELIHSLGGTTSGEHGIGITKAPDFYKERKTMIPLMKTVKKAMDPNNIMNPHKVDQWTDDFLHELRYPTNPDRKLSGPLAKWEEEMMTCTMCGYCKNVCPTFISLLWDPPSSRGRMIMSYGILEGELEPDDSVVKAIYQCTLCRDCNRRCPSKVKVPDVVRAARAELVERGLAYDAHKAFIDNIKKTGNIFADEEVMAPIQEGETPVFIGCQFLARPNKTKMYLRLFQKLGIKPKVVKEICCGYPMEALGFVKDFEEHKKKFKELFPYDTAITLCPTCTVYLKEAYGIDAKHAVQVIAEKLPQAQIKKNSGKVTYHDPCDLSRGAKVTKEPREIIKQLGFELVEMKFKDNVSRCCGGGGGILVSDKSLSDVMAEKRIQEAAETGCDTLVTACATCEQVLMNAANAFVEKKGNPRIKIMGLQQLVWKALA
ncbi:MAG TPA: FAD-binding protein [candidate division WOR-3 bacterium]|uniref:FAD-binding protein n=1 Tax=candidate division WOR-3 bacterium TaxID=2052148 RepID=A0A9C9EM61_UNCW3|nr:FAD-binding protein [candidate division WOR-3 bacterium]